MFVQVFASGIDTRTIYGSFLVPDTQGFKCPPPGLVVVQIAVYFRVSVQMAERSGKIADRIKHHRIVSFGEAERYGGEEVEEALEHVASSRRALLPRHKGDVFRRYAPLELPASQLPSSRHVRKADSEIRFPMHAVADLPTMPDGHIGRYAPLGKIAFQYVVGQCLFLDLTECRLGHLFPDGRRQADRNAHPRRRVRDIPRLREKIRASDQLSGKGEDVAAASQTEIEPYIPVGIHFERGRLFLAVRRIVPQVVSFLPHRIAPQPLKKDAQRQPTHFLNRHVRPSVDNEFQPYAVLRMEPSRRAAPQAPLADVHHESDTVGQVAFQFQRYRTAVDKGVLVREVRAVEQGFVAPIHRFVPRECRAAEVEEENLAGVGEEVVVETAFRRKLRRRNPSVLIGVVALQVFAAEHPLIAAFGVGRHRRSDVVARIVAARVRIEPVGHAAPKLDAPHFGEASLRVGLPCKEGKRRDEKKQKPLHDYCTLSSLMTLARTRSSFSMVND